MTTTDDITAELRYSRHVALEGFGAGAQRRLGDARVLLIGAGGLGSAAGLYLAAAGAGRIEISDFDTVDASNLQRQIAHRNGDIGRRKALSARDNLAALNPEIIVEALDHRLQSEELLARVDMADVVVDGSDNFGTRFAVNEACVETKTPLVSGAAIRFEGQVAVFDAREGNAPCYRCLYDDAAEEDFENCRNNGVLGPLVGVIGSMQAVEAIKLIAGVGEPLRGRLVRYNAFTGKTRISRLHRDPECPVCSAETG